MISASPTNTARVTSVAFDLSTSIVTDAVFDPVGTAGDAVAKDFTPDSGQASTGLTTHSFSSPNGGGYDALAVDFGDFQGGETFTFSVDIDPTSIKGAAQPGPSDSGSVSGLELTGSSVTVGFSDGSVVSGQIFASTTSDGGGQVTLSSELTGVPTLALVGGTSPTTVTGAGATLTVSGTPNSRVHLLQTESALFLAGVPNGGFDIDPYERNSVVAINRLVVDLGPSGTAQVPVTLGRTLPEGGINHFIAVEVDATGRHRLTSNAVIVTLERALSEPASEHGRLRQRRSSLPKPTFWSRHGETGSAQDQCRRPARVGSRPAISGRARSMAWWTRSLSSRCRTTNSMP